MPFGRAGGFATQMEFKGDFNPALGKAFQGFLLADVSGLPENLRRSLAEKQLEIRQVEADSIAPAALLQQSTAFRQFLEKRFSPTQIFVKFPLQGQVGKRFIELDIDFFLETADGIVLLKTADFAEGMKKWKAHAQGIAPVLGWARRLLRQLWPDKNVETWVLFPLDGQAVKLELA